MALVEMIVPYFATIELEKVSENGIALIMSLIKDENQPIRIGIAQRIKDLNEVLGEENTEKYVLPMIESSLTDKKWRFKLAIAEGIAPLLKKLDVSKNKAFVDKIIKSFTKDHYAAVRDQTFASLCELKSVFGS